MRDQGRPLGPPTGVRTLQVLLAMPCLGLWYAAAQLLDWHWAAWAAGLSVAATVAAMALGRGSGVARVAVFGVGTLVLVIGVLGFVVGIPLILVWGLGLLVMAAAVPVIAWACVVIACAVSGPVQLWCGR